MSSRLWWTETPWVTVGPASRRRSRSSSHQCGSDRQIRIRRARLVARRRARCRTRPRARDRRRNRRLQRGRHRDRVGCERDDPRTIDRSHATTGRDPLGAGQPRDVVQPADRRIDQRLRRRHWRRARPWSQGPETHHPRDAEKDAGGQRACGHRRGPGRLRRNHAPHHAQSAHLSVEEGVIHYCVANMPPPVPIPALPPWP